MVKVVWDSTLHPNKVLTPIEQWDEWFALVGLTEVWQAVKDTFEDERQRLGWATVIEFNRISQETKNKSEVTSGD